MHSRARQAIVRYGPMLLVIALAIGVHLWMMVQWTANLNSDEAVFGLMARHTLEGRPPTFMYGSTYQGSIEPLLSAVLMRIFGQTVFVFRLSTLAFYAFFLLAHAIYVRRHFGERVALVSLLILALPSVEILYETGRPISAYGAMLFLGTLALLLSDKLPQASRMRTLRLFLLGVVIGLGVWSHVWFIVYIAAIAIPHGIRTPEWQALRERFYQPFRDAQFRWVRFLPALTPAALLVLLTLAFFSSGCQPIGQFAALQRAARLLLFLEVGYAFVLAFKLSTRRRALIQSGLAFAGGFLVGDAPQWRAIFLYGSPPSTAINASCPASLPQRAWTVFGTLLPHMWGTDSIPAIVSTPRWGMLRWALPLVLAFGGFGYFFWSQRRLWADLAIGRCIPAQSRALASWGLLLVLPLGLTLLGTHNEAVVRYLLITWQASSVVLALFFVRLASDSRWALGALVIVFAVQIGLWSMVSLGQQWRADREQFSPVAIAQLEEHLAHHTATGGFADYWIAYSVDLVSEERITIAPYNGIDRYQPYTEHVLSLPTLAYILPRDVITAESNDISELRRAIQQRSVAGPAFVWALEPLNEGAVLDRAPVAHWDVWIVAWEGT